jgi:uncharacterized protein YceK
MNQRLYGVSLLVTLLLGGCATSLREVRAQEPRYTRQGIGMPEAIAHCVQDYLQEHFGGIVVGRLAGLVYEVRREDTASYLIGRVALAPSDVLFVLALTPTGPNAVEAQMTVMRIVSRIAMSVVVVVITLAGCSTYAAQRYSIAPTNIVGLRAFRGQAFNVGQFTAAKPGRSEITCRAVGQTKTPDGEPFEEYIRKAFIAEMGGRPCSTRTYSR